MGQLKPHAVDCLLWLVQLLGDPRGLAMLTPSIVRELYYWLVNSKQGTALRQLPAPVRYALGIADAINLMQAKFAAPICIGHLASRVGISPGSFLAHVKSITSVTPMQDQKLLRLLQGKRKASTVLNPAMN